MRAVFSVVDRLCTVRERLFGQLLLPQQVPRGDLCIYNVDSWCTAIVDRGVIVPGFSGLSYSLGMPGLGS